MVGPGVNIILLHMQLCQLQLPMLMSQNSAHVSGNKKATMTNGPAWPSNVKEQSPVSKSQSRAVLSQEADARTLTLVARLQTHTTPSSEQLDTESYPGIETAARMGPAWPTNRVQSSVATSQTRTAQSSEPVTSMPSPIPLKATVRTALWWPASILTQVPTMVSQSRTVPSLWPVATCWPSAEKATVHTLPLLVLSVAKSSCVQRPDFRLQSLAAPSKEPVIKRAQQGEHANAQTALR